MILLNVPSVERHNRNARLTDRIILNRMNTSAIDFTIGNEPQGSSENILRSMTMLVALIGASWFMVCSVPDNHCRAGLVCLVQDNIDDSSEVKIFSENTSDGIVFVVKHLKSPGTAKVKVWLWDANINSDPAMLGTVTLRGDDLIFRPRFPISAGQEYNVGVTIDEKSKPSHFRFAVPSAEKAAAVVEHIYPSADTLPENTLKFYVHFSAPMRKGGIYRYVRIREVGGKDVELPFLEIEQEFWSRDSKRLTLLLDPGRIKRGLKPREEMGPIFIQGKSYELVVDGQWPDANGKPLGKEVVKRFRVGGEDHSQPNPAKWQVAAPNANSRQLLEIDLGESLDHSMLNSAIEVFNAEGESIEGNVGISKQETHWSLKPAQEWRTGTYTIKVNGRLEDNAGNSIEKLFDVDMFDKTQPIEATTSKLKFAVEVEAD